MVALCSPTPRRGTFGGPQPHRSNQGHRFDIESGFRRCYAHRRVFGIRLDVEETRALQLIERPGQTSAAERQHPAAFLCPPENLPYPLPRKTDHVPNRLEGRTCFPRLRNRLITLDPARNLMPHF